MSTLACRFHRKLPINVSQSRIGPRTKEKDNHVTVTVGCCVNQGRCLLEKGTEERGWFVRLLRIAPDFDSLRSHPRFKKLLVKVGLDEWPRITPGLS